MATIDRVALPEGGMPQAVSPIAPFVLSAPWCRGATRRLRRVGAEDTP